MKLKHFTYIFSTMYFVINTFFFILFWWIVLHYLRVKDFSVFIHYLHVISCKFLKNFHKYLILNFPSVYLSFFLLLFFAVVLVFWEKVNKYHDYWKQDIYNCYFLSPWLIERNKYQRIIIIKNLPWYSLSNIFFYIYNYL